MDEIKKTDIQVDWKLVDKEKKRLRKILKDALDGHVKAMTEGLIERAAFLRASIEAAEDDIAVNGYTEPFAQSLSVAPYMRIRPIATQYNAMVSSYGKICKELVGLLPKDSTSEKDALLEFISK